METDIVGTLLAGSLVSQVGEDKARRRHGKSPGLEVPRDLLYHCCLYKIIFNIVTMGLLLLVHSPFWVSLRSRDPLFFIATLFGFVRKLRCVLICQIIKNGVARMFIESIEPNAGIKGWVTRRAMWHAACHAACNAACITELNGDRKECGGSGWSGLLQAGPQQRQGAAGQRGQGQQQRQSVWRPAWGLGARVACEGRRGRTRRWEAKGTSFDVRGRAEELQMIPLQAQVRWAP